MRCDRRKSQIFVCQTNFDGELRENSLVPLNLDRLMSVEVDL